METALKYIWIVGSPWADSKSGMAIAVVWNCNRFAAGMHEGGKRYRCTTLLFTTHVNRVKSGAPIGAIVLGNFDNLPDTIGADWSESGAI